MSDVALSGAGPYRELPAQRLYVEAAERRETALETLLVGAHSRMVAATTRRRARNLRRILPLVTGHEAELRELATERFPGAVRDAAIELRRKPDLPDAAVARAFALIRELADRILGQRHYDVQVLGAFGMVRGMLTEMATGEGKTLTATLVAGVAGLAGIPIHVVTVNDYLAKRDAELMTPLYAALGLRVGIVQSGQNAGERRAAYACDITYCTNKELAFDYLRDRILLGQTTGDLPLKIERLYSPTPVSEQLRLRGLHFALVDEADSVLIDEARTPLIISGAGENPIDEATVASALGLAESLRSGDDFIVASEERRIHLTAAGQTRIDAFARNLGGHWRSAVSREELARQALSAIHLFERGKHYLVVDGKVQIVDEYTGRIMPDRSWSQGLHQMIEHKEGCALSLQHRTLARITYQRFFRRYRRLAGMSGTVQPVAAELWQVYRLPVVTIPTAKPVRRIHHPDVVVATEREKWLAIVARAVSLHARGIPILIGTRSVASSERASAELTAAGLRHTVLNAIQDRHEADIVAEAGEHGRITVATNMAGRGTDIHLGEGVEALGGLHVIMTERHDARRIDLQLGGRAGRQGQRGSFEAILSLEDPLMDTETGVALSGIAKLLARYLGPWVGREVANYAQRRAERLHARMRADLLRSDRSQAQTLAFSGRPE